MGLFDRRDSIDSLSDLLERERAAILKGDFQALERMLAEKERLIGLVGKSASNLASLESVQRNVARNNKMLAAAGRGIRAAKQRIEASLNEGPGFQTYDNSGKKRPDIRSGPTLERRA